jgi:hypothetical protein
VPAVAADVPPGTLFLVRISYNASSRAAIPN